MRVGEGLRVATTAIAANRLRSLLTAIGVVIGVMSVVVLVAVGTGARDEVTSQVEGLGSNLVFVVPGGFEGPGQAPTRSPFTAADLDRLDRALSGRALVSGNLSSGERVRGPQGQQAANVLGVTADYVAVLDTAVARGRFLTDSDVAVGRRVAVLGPTAADNLFAGRDPLGQPITVAGVRFEVVGLTEGFGQAFGVDRDAQVLIPLGAAQQLFGTQRLDTLLVRAPSADAVGPLVAEVEAVLAESLDDDRFSVLTQDDILGVVGEILGILTWVLAAIAGISLLVAGVGVSNIMLVSVAERTREIGLRKALGARTRDVTAQFLAEALLLCGLGGLVGLAAGVGLATLAAAVSPVPATITWWNVTLAFGVSLAVGVTFGTLPALRAGRLDPVVALRHE